MRQVWPSPPTPTTTGVPAGTSLTTYTGDRYINSVDHGDNYTFNNMLFTSGLVVEVNNVTFNNCKIAVDNPYGIDQNSGYYGININNVEITSKNPGANEYCDRALNIEGGGAVVDRLLVRNTWRGINTLADDIVIRRSFVGQNNNPPDTEHSSAIHSEGGADNVRIEYCYLEVLPDTEGSGVFAIYPEGEDDPNTNWKIIGNVVADAGVYSVKVGYTSPETPNSDFEVRDNWFSTAYRTYTTGGQWPVQEWSDVAGTAIWENNRWYDLRATGGGYTNKHGELIGTSNPLG